MRFFCETLTRTPERKARLILRRVLFRTLLSNSRLESSRSRQWRIYWREGKTGSGSDLSVRNSRDRQRCSIAYRRAYSMSSLSCSPLSVKGGQASVKGNDTPRFPVKKLFISMTGIKAASRLPVQYVMYTGR